MFYLGFWFIKEVLDVMINYDNLSNTWQVTWQGQLSMAWAVISFSGGEWKLPAVPAAWSKVWFVEI